MTLDGLKPGHFATILSTNGSGELRLRLLDMGLIPGSSVKMQKTAPLGDPVQILIRGYELTVRKEDAAKIEIREEKNR